MPSIGEGTLHVALAAAVVGTLPTDIAAARATTAAGLVVFNQNFTRAQVAFDTLQTNGTPQAGAIEDAMVALHGAGGDVAAQGFLDTFGTWVAQLNAAFAGVNAVLPVILTYATA